MIFLKTRKTATVKVACFQGSAGPAEYHLMMIPESQGSFLKQAEDLYQIYQETLRQLRLKMETAVFQRFFCSDLANQAEALQAAFFSCGKDTTLSAVSLVEQPPLPPARVALWAYHLADSQLVKTGSTNFLSLSRGKLSHHWLTGITAAGNSAYRQSWKVFRQCTRLLQKKGMTLPDNLIRTWLFVRDIDNNYQGLVAARKEFFATCGLTPETHFVASSGIGGGSSDRQALVTLDAYAISGIGKEQISYLSAPEHMSPTYLYGVTFERGTAVSYSDRKHVINSGTASIDRAGRILYPEDVQAQFERTLDNISALLSPAGATLKEVATFTGYVRDPADQKRISQAMEALFPETPFLILLAPVCRPGWLVELEGLAVIPASYPHLPSF